MTQTNTGQIQITNRNAETGEQEQGLRITYGPFNQDAGHDLATPYPSDGPSQWSGALDVHDKAGEIPEVPEISFVDKVGNVTPIDKNSPKAAAMRRHPAGRKYSPAEHTEPDQANPKGLQRLDLPRPQKLRDETGKQIGEHFGTRVHYVSGKPKSGVLRAVQQNLRPDLKDKAPENRGVGGRQHYPVEPKRLKLRPGVVPKTKADREFAEGIMRRNKVTGQAAKLAIRGDGLKEFFKS